MTNRWHSSRHGSSQEFPRLVHSTCTSSSPALEMHSVQCSRASQPTFKNPLLELPELQNSVLCIPLTVLSEKEVI